MAFIIISIFEILGPFILLLGIEDDGVLVVQTHLDPTLNDIVDELLGDDLGLILSVKLVSVVSVLVSTSDVFVTACRCVARNRIYYLVWVHKGLLGVVCLVECLLFLGAFRR